MPTKSKATTDGDKPAKKSLLKPITGKKAAPVAAEEDKKAAASKAKEEEKKKAPKPEKKATVSLIDDEGKLKPAARPVRKAAGSGAVLPTISKIRDSEAPVPTPEPAPAAPAAVAATAPVAPATKTLMPAPPRARCAASRPAERSPAGARPGWPGRARRDRPRPRRSGG